MLFQVDLQHFGRSVLPYGGITRNRSARSPFQCVDLCYTTNAFAMLLWQKVLVLQSPRSDTRSLLRWQSSQKANIQAQIILKSIIWAYFTSSRVFLIILRNIPWVMPSCHRYIHLLPANPGCIQRGHHPRNPPTLGRSCQALQTLELRQNGNLPQGSGWK